MTEKMIQRRLLMKSAAWTAPIVGTTTIVPVYAASTTSATCHQANKIDNHTKIYDGVVGRTGQNARAWFSFGSVELTIPRGVTVVSATVGFWMAKHSGRNDGSNVGFPSPSDSTMRYYSINANGARSSLARVSGAPSSGYFWNHTDNIAVNSSAGTGPAYVFDYLGESTQTWSDGSRSTGWGIQTTWKPGDPRQGLYGEAGNCQTFTIESLGGMQWVAQNIYVPVNRQLTHWRFWNILLSDGTTIAGQESRPWVGDPNYRG